MINDVKIYDGEYEIIFSGTFNVYDSVLKITSIAGFDFIFSFDDEQFDPTGKIEVIPDATSKKINVSFKKFRNQFGAVNENKLPVVEQKDGKKIFLSVYGKAMDPKSKFIQLSVNFYIK